jgi:hypothetical protein
MRSILERYAGQTLAAVLLFVSVVLLELPQELRETWLDGQHAASRAAEELIWRIQQGAM